MEKRVNIPRAKNRILQAAVKIFAEKSFEGSRIDEIAKEAGVPKSLIYYHFKSKNEILEVLFQDFLTGLSGLLQIAENDTHRSKAEVMPVRSDHYRDFYIKNADLIRVILIESLKKSSLKPVIFKVAEAITNADGKFIVSKNPDKYDKNERLVAEFFTNIIPTFTFLSFYNSWTGYFGIDGNSLAGLFTKTWLKRMGFIIKIMISGNRYASRNQSY